MTLSDIYGKLLILLLVLLMHLTIKPISFLFCFLSEYVMFMMKNTLKPWSFIKIKRWRYHLNNTVFKYQRDVIGIMLLLLLWMLARFLNQLFLVLKR